MAEGRREGRREEGMERRVGERKREDEENISHSQNK